MHHVLGTDVTLDSPFDKGSDEAQSVDLDPELAELGLSPASSVISEVLSEADSTASAPAGTPCLPILHPCMRHGSIQNASWNA